MRYDLGLGSLTTDGSISLLYLFTSAAIPNGSLNFLILLTSSDFLSSLFISDFLSSLDLFILSSLFFFFSSVFWGSQVKSSHVINVFRRQGCPHLGQGHGPIVSSRHRI